MKNSNAQKQIKTQNSNELKLFEKDDKFITKADKSVENTFAEKYYTQREKTASEVVQTQNTLVENAVVEEFVKLQLEYGFSQSWIEAFIWSMESDFYWQNRVNTKHNYETLEDTEKYIYGSADVVGLMMCKILKIPEKAYIYAQKLGFAFQYINFIRDVDEDVKLGRNYFPRSEMSKHSLTSLEYKDIISSKVKIEQFESFLRAQIDFYRKVQNEAMVGFKYIPWRYRLPIITASKMYLWTAKIIYQNPLIVFQKKVKPSKKRIIATFFMSLLSSTQF
jgi:phytoene synthase